MKKKTKQDLKLEAMAVRRGWNIKPTYYDKLPQKMFSIANNPEMLPRTVVEATKCLISMDKANIQAEAASKLPDLGDNPILQQRLQELIDESCSTSPPDLSLGPSPPLPS